MCWEPWPRRMALCPTGLTALRGRDGVKMFCHPKE